MPKDMGSQNPRDPERSTSRTKRESKQTKLTNPRFRRSGTEDSSNSGGRDLPRSSGSSNDQGSQENEPDNDNDEKSSSNQPLWRLNIVTDVYAVWPLFGPLKRALDRVGHLVEVITVDPIVREKSETPTHEIRWTDSKHTPSKEDRTPTEEATASATALANATAVDPDKVLEFTYRLARTLIEEERHPETESVLKTEATAVGLDPDKIIGDRIENAPEPESLPEEPVPYIELDPPWGQKPAILIPPFESIDIVTPILDRSPSDVDEPDVPGSQLHFGECSREIQAFFDQSAEE